MKKAIKPFMRLTALILALSIIAPTVALAVYVVGASGSPGKSGTLHNTDNTGLIAQWQQSFRVGLSRDPMGAPLAEKDAPDTLKNRLESQYQTRYPDNSYRADNWPKPFLPYGHAKTLEHCANGITYTEYDPASGEILAYNDPNIAANTMICSGTTVTGSTGVYYSQLKSKLGNETRLDGLLSYWKTIATNKASSLSYWSYILEAHPQGNVTNADADSVFERLLAYLQQTDYPGNQDLDDYGNWLAPYETPEPLPLPVYRDKTLTVPEE